MTAIIALTGLTCAMLYLAFGTDPARPTTAAEDTLDRLLFWACLVTVPACLGALIWVALG